MSAAIRIVIFHWVTCTVKEKLFFDLHPKYIKAQSCLGWFVKLHTHTLPKLTLLCLSDQPTQQLRSPESTLLSTMNEWMSVCTSSLPPCVPNSVPWNGSQLINSWQFAQQETVNPTLGLNSKARRMAAFLSRTWLVLKALKSWQAGPDSLCLHLCCWNRDRSLKRRLSAMGIHHCLLASEPLTQINNSMVTSISFTSSHWDTLHPSHCLTFLLNKGLCDISNEYYTLTEPCQWREFLAYKLITTYQIKTATHLWLTHDWECYLTCHSSCVKELAQWVDPQKAEVGLRLPEQVQEVKADLLIEDKLGSNWKDNFTLFS